MGAMRAEEERWREVVFKEHLSGEERLSYEVWWRLKTPHVALSWAVSDEMGVHHLEREIWPDETLFIEIALAFWDVEVYFTLSIL